MSASHSPQSTPSSATVFNLLQRHLGPALFLLSTLACMGGGSKLSGDHAGQINGKFQITPSSVTVVVGQSVTFSASSPWGGAATWSVQPASAGIMEATGRFTAGSTAGACQVVAMWKDDVRYTAVAAVTILAAPPPAHASPAVVQAFGRSQISEDGAYRNGAVAGELVPAKPSGNESLQVRHGFEPPPVR